MIKSIRSVNKYLILESPAPKAAAPAAEKTPPRSARYNPTPFAKRLNKPPNAARSSPSPPTSTTKKKFGNASVVPRPWASKAFVASTPTGRERGRPRRTSTAPTASCATRSSSSRPPPSRRPSSLARTRARSILSITASALFVARPSQFSRSIRIASRLARPVPLASKSKPLPHFSPRAWDARPPPRTPRTPRATRRLARPRLHRARAPFVPSPIARARATTTNASIRWPTPPCGTKCACAAAR